MSEVQTLNNPAPSAPVFTPVETPAAAQTPATQPAPVQDQTVAFDPAIHTPVEKTTVLDGYSTLASDIRDAATEKEANKPQPKAPEAPKQDWREQPLPENYKIAGKFVSVAAAEKSIKELERQFHGQRQHKSDPDAAQLRTQLTQLQGEVDFYKKNYKPESLDIPEPVLLDGLRNDPVNTVNVIVEKALQKRDMEEKEKSAKLAQERMTANISGNIQYLEEKYPEFEGKRQDFAQFMMDRQMHTGYIMSNRDIADRTYNEYLRLNGSESPEGIEREKMAQSPAPAGSASAPHPKLKEAQSQGIFQPINDPAAPQAQPWQREVDAFEDKIGVGSSGNSMW